jgi:ubiquinone/menaquinone biosynthesis C-methylase UbiE
MEAKLQRRVQRYGWDRAAPHYDECWRDALAPATARLLALAQLKPGERVLDVACGTGAIALAAARAVGARGAVLGTDISEKMVEAAGAAARALGYAHCRFERCDAEEIRADGGFDVALCGLGLMYVPDPERAVARMAACVERGGRVVVSVWGRRERCGWAEIFPIVDARVESEVCPLFFRLGSGDALGAALKAVGLGEVLVDRISATLRYGSAEEAARAALAGGPVALAYSRFDAATRTAVEVQYLRSIEPYRVAAGYEIPGEFVIARGMRSR